MAAHARGQVVEAEQVVEGLRIGGPPFHLVQQGQLPVQQRLAAPGQAAEHVVEPLPQPGFIHGRRTAVWRTRSKSLPILALISSPPTRSAGSAFTSTFSPAPSLLTMLGQLNLGELEGVLALEPAEAADDAAGDERGDQDGNDSPRRLMLLMAATRTQAPWAIR